MRPVLALAVMALAACPLSAKAQAFEVQSGTYKDFRQLLSREAPSEKTAIAMTLRLPDRMAERHPAVVLVHTLGGYQEANEGWHAEQLRKSGFATLTYDSAAVRRLREGDAASGRPSAIAESFSALQLLADNPRIDADRIAIVGFSFGGEVAHLSALERLRAALLPGGIRFAAHVAYYPAGVYGAMAAPGTYTGAPILMLLGARDDNLPIAKVQDYLAYAETAGTRPPLQVITYPDAYHAWTVSSLGGSPTFYPQYRSMRKCPYLLLGTAAPAVLVDGREQPIDPSVLQSCRTQGQGYTMAFDESARAASTRDAVAFLLRTLRAAP